MAKEEPIFPINGTDFFCKFKLTGPSGDDGKKEIQFSKSAIVVWSSRVGATKV